MRKKWSLGVVELLGLALQRDNICYESKRGIKSSVLDLEGDWNCLGRKMVEICMSGARKYGLEIEVRESKDLGVNMERLKQTGSVSRETGRGA